MRRNVRVIIAKGEGGGEWTNLCEYNGDNNDSVALVQKTRTALNSK